LTVVNENDVDFLYKSNIKIKSLTKLIEMKLIETYRNVMAT